MSERAHSLIEHLARTVAAHTLFSPGDTVLVAVSGGGDSMALLHLLIESGISVAVAHFDHQTRNGESAEDAAFVCEAAAALGVPFHCACRPIEAEATASRDSFETYARKARYAFLVETAQAHGCAAVATGHTADDQAETVLMRILRGTSPQGLAGIPPVRVEQGIHIVRPLLDCGRAELRAYLADRNIAFREDASNADTRFVRNRVRHVLLPQLREAFNPQIEDALRRLADSQRCENAFLEELAADLLDTALDAPDILLRAPFRDVHEAVQRRALARLAYRHGVQPDYARLAAAAAFVCSGPAGAALDLGGGFLLRNGRNHTELLPVSGGNDAASPAQLNIPGETVAFGVRISARLIPGRPAEDLAAYCTPGRQVFDSVGLGRPVLLRHRRPGDRFQPFGMDGTRKLKDFLIDRHVPAGLRNRLLLVEGARGIAWVVGHAISRDAAVTETTTSFVEIEVHGALE